MDGFVVLTGNVFMTKTRVIMTSKFVALNSVVGRYGAAIHLSLIYRRSSSLVC